MLTATALMLCSLTHFENVPASFQVEETVTRNASSDLQDVLLSDQKLKLLAQQNGNSDGLQFAQFGRTRPNPFQNGQSRLRQMQEESRQRMEKMQRDNRKRHEETMRRLKQSQQESMKRMEEMRKRQINHPIMNQPTEISRQRNRDQMIESSFPKADQPNLNTFKQPQQSIEDIHAANLKHFHQEQANRNRLQQNNNFTPQQSSDIRPANSSNTTSTISNIRGIRGFIKIIILLFMGGGFLIRKLF